MRLDPLPRAVLFDLDGTLIDSAPDLAGAANDLRHRRGLPPLAFEQLRPMVGAGARGMLQAALGVHPGEAGFESLRDDFLALYAGRLLRRTRVFDDVPALLDALESRACPWGVVTNKMERYAQPVLRGLKLERRAATVICGDTTPHAKPHPRPLFEAARRLGVDAGDCVYIGDDLRDVQAGRAAGMRTVVAGWGYLGAGEPVDTWGADAIAAHPREILKLLGLG